jgi:hypothetical protein
MLSKIFGMLFVSIGFLLMPPATAASDDARAEIIYHSIFLRDDTRPWTELPIDAPVRRRTLRLIPRATGVFSMVGLRCETLAPDGRLSDCTVETEPDNPKLKAIGVAIASDLRADRDFARKAQGKVRFISIQIKVSNSPVPAFQGPCWPPACILEPAPPTVPAR